MEQAGGRQGTDAGFYHRIAADFSTGGFLPGKGLDIGTTNVVAIAQHTERGRLYNIQRNAFIDVRSDVFTTRMLAKLGIEHVVEDGKGYVIGDPAFELANIFEKDTRHPMRQGVISAAEPQSLRMLTLLLARVLGKPSQPGEICTLSVPADPVDAETNVIYHRGSVQRIVEQMGYTPKAVVEGEAVIFAELAEDDYTGIGISCGGGMFNICVSYKSVPAMTFSTTRGGDWIDINVSRALGIPPSQVCAVKEGGVDLTDPKGVVEDAIAIHYRSLIRSTLETIRNEFHSLENAPTFVRPVDLVCGGGTALIKGFIDLFRREVGEIDFPLELKGIRLARDPLRTVADGCLTAAHHAGGQ